MIDAIMIDGQIFLQCDKHKFAYHCWRDLGHTGDHFDWDYYAICTIGGRVWEDGEEGESPSTYTPTCWNYDVKDWPSDAIANLLSNGTERIKNHIKKELAEKSPPQ